MHLHQVAVFCFSLCHPRLLPYLTLPPSVQLPDSIITIILASCTQTDQSNFRLVCKAWCDLTPAHTFQKRVTIRHHPGWEQTALQVRQRLPNSVIVVRTSSITGLAGLLQNPHCDIVSCVPQSFSVFPQWRLLQIWEWADKKFYLQAPKQALFSSLADTYEQAPAENRQRLELQLCLNSEQIVDPAISADLLRLRPAITELREVARMETTANMLFPMDSLKICAPMLPRSLRIPRRLLSAMKLATNLEFLQIYVHTKNTSKVAVRFIEMLPDLPRVTSLRLISQKCATCLPVACLQNITRLELGQGVYIDGLPSSLRSLALQKLSIDAEGYAQMLTNLCLATEPISMTVQRCEVAALLSLDANLHEFRLQSPMFNTVRPEDSRICRSSLARLSNLTVLCVSDFLTAGLVALLESLCFPQLHTFGFTVEQQDSSDYFVVLSLDPVCVVHSPDSYMLTPSQDISKLGVTFPALQHLKIVCRSEENVALVIRAEGICLAFPGLCDIRCYSPVPGLELVGVPRRVQVADKFCDWLNHGQWAEPISNPMQ